MARPSLISRRAAESASRGRIGRAPAPRHDHQSHPADEARRRRLRILPERAGPHPSPTLTSCALTIIFFWTPNRKTRAPLFRHLDKFIIADDVTLEDVTGETYCLGLEGPTSADVAQSAAFPAPNHRYSHMDWGEASLASIAMTGDRGRPYLWTSGAPVMKLSSRWKELGAIAASPEDAEAARIRNRRARLRT